MNDSSWAISDEISGAVNNWKTKLKKPLITKPIFDNKKLTLKWGMYKFEGESGLYCPVCYEKDGLKIPASRVNSRYYQCPNCHAKLS